MTVRLVAQKSTEHKFTINDLQEQVIMPRAVSYSGVGRK